MWNSVIIREYSVASFVLLENYYAIVFLSLSMKSLYSSSWINTKSGATQVYPQFAYLKVHIFKAALLRSAPLSIIVGHFPPNSKIQGIRFSAAALAINFPFSGEPVKIIKSHLYYAIELATFIAPSNTV